MSSDGIDGGYEDLGKRRCWEPREAFEDERETKDSCEEGVSIETRDFWDEYRKLVCAS
jgi:hypothetical protein